MTKSEIISQLLTQKLVVVIRGNTEEEAYEASKACIAGGITAIEIAYSNNKASQVIEHLTNDYINSKKCHCRGRYSLRCCDSSNGNFSRGKIYRFTCFQYRNCKNLQPLCNSLSAWLYDTNRNNNCS